MKDSRIGAFGVIGLGAVLVLKFLCLSQLNPDLVPFVLIAGHSLSRFFASTLLFTLKYVQEDSQSKVKPAAKKMSGESLFIGALIGILPIFLIQNYYCFLLVLPVFAVRIYMGMYFQKWIGGQTGDCAGATQQICEVVFYLSFIALWKFI